jgi:hypothetical protein
VFKDKDIYTAGQGNTGFSKLLKLNGKDYDADTTESEEAKGVQNAFGSLIQAVNATKKSAPWKTGQLEGQRKAKALDLKSCSSIKSRMLEKEKEWFTEKSLISAADPN